MRLKKGVNLTAAQMQLYTKIMRDVVEERMRQIRKFGAQAETPSLPPEELLATLFVGTEDACKSACDTAFREGHGSWAHIVIEELAESVEAQTITERRTEVLQLMTCCLGWLEAIDAEMQRNAAEAVRRNG